MRVLVIENFVNTPLGLVGTALRQAGAEIELRRAHLGEPLPADPGEHDALVILGGGQSAVDDADSPWLPGLAALARAFGDADQAVLGVCLGAQLLARAYGATNILAQPVEFGWREVHPTAAGKGDPLVSALGEGAPIFHWHQDTFTLPPGAAHLATSAMTDMQGFRIGRAVYGIQFHFEADRAHVAQWSEDFAAEIGATVPDWPERHAGEAARHGARADAIGLEIARRWVGLIRPVVKRAAGG
jgi:GMP synthase-like glutamine amidotransferase